MDVEEIVRPVVEADGLEFVEASFGREGGRRVLRVFVDREGGIDLETIAATSERISRRLDVENFSPGPYELEVSSPGIERPLRTPRDFRRKVGERVRVKVADPPETFEGRLEAADDDGISVRTERGGRRLSYEEVSSARTIFDWGDVQ